jgi:hypothetical protein
VGHPPPLRASLEAAAFKPVVAAVHPWLPRARAGARARGCEMSVRARGVRIYYDPGLGRADVFGLSEVETLLVEDR